MKRVQISTAQGDQYALQSKANVRKQFRYEDFSILCWREGRICVNFVSHRSHLFFPFDICVQCTHFTVPIVVGVLWIVSVNEWMSEAARNREKNEKKTKSLSGTCEKNTDEHNDLSHLAKCFYVHTGDGLVKTEKTWLLCRFSQCTCALGCCVLQQCNEHSMMMQKWITKKECHIQILAYGETKQRPMKKRNTRNARTQCNDHAYFCWRKNKRSENIKKNFRWCAMRVQVYLSVCVCPYAGINV